MAIRSGRSDVLIVGGGIIGTLSAIALTARGARVTILERGTPMAESSWAGAGILSPIYPWLYPDGLSELVNDSLMRYPALVERLQAVSGVDPQHRRSGLIIPTYGPDEWQALAGAESWSQRFGWPVERLDGAAARQVEPCLGPGVLGGLYWPEVGQIRNPRLAQAAQATAIADGVTIRSGVEVTDFDMDGGRVTGLWSAEGRHGADQVLLAAGSWTGSLAERIGYQVPVRPVKGQILLLKTEPGTLRRIVKHADAYLVPRADGHILVGATMEMAGFDRRATLSALNFLSGALMEMTPPLADAEVVTQWTGFRPGTPDGLPYLGAVPGYDNLFISAGHYRNGVILAPASAAALAALMCGETPSVALTPFAPERQAAHHQLLGFPSG